MECTVIILPPILNAEFDAKLKVTRDIFCRAINREFSLDSSDRSVAFETYKRGKCEKHNLVEYVSDAKITASIKFNPNMKLNADSLVNRFTEENIFQGKLDYWLYLSQFQILGEARSFVDAKICDKLYTNEVAFGSVVGFNLFVQHYTSNSDELTRGECFFEHNDKIVVKFSIFKAIKINGKKISKRDIKKNGQFRERKFEMIIDYNSIRKLVIARANWKENKRKFEGYDLYIFTNNPVKICTYYVPIDKEYFTNSSDSETDDSEEGKYEQEEIHKEGKKKGQWIRVVKFGSCEAEVMLKSPVVKIRLSSESKRSWEVIKQLTICLGDEIQVFFAHLETIIRENVIDGISKSCLKANYQCYFASQCVLSATFQFSDEIFLKQNGPVLSRRFKEMCNENGRALELSLCEISRLLEQHELRDIESALVDLYEKYKDGYLKEPIYPTEMIEMRRAVLTPLGLTFKPSLPYLKSTLMRNCDPSYGIRVSVEDVCGNSLSHTLTGSVEHRGILIKKSIRPYLENGFKVGPRHYEFFGCSSSQMREHGCFFYAKDADGRTASHLRSIIGSLDNIKTVPKYLARMGQSLSQAMVRVIVEKSKTEVVPDITRGGYVFSDGVGRMSPRIAQKIYGALHLEADDKPSAFQIRYGGCKGMLVIDPTLPGEKIIFRQSMAKFDSPLESLEIIKISRPLSVYLNKSFITILEHLGVKDSVFMSLQTRALTDLTASLIDSEKAADLLKTEAAIRLPYTLLHKAGFDLANDAYFKPVVMALYCRTIALLRTKARIKIPFGKGRTMFGVLDETGQLGPEEVFVQYSHVIDDKQGVTSKISVYKGEILVTKNPCTHEGDVRKFQAVDIPELRHVVDCIVFPQNGDRPLPDQMAGSDLDGDEYCVIWLEELLFEGPNREPMDYTNDVVVTENDNISVSDMCDFMCTYLLQSGVGLFANAHLVWADRFGLKCPECYTLAKKYSLALDFAKTGKTPFVSRRERVNMYPDFMEKHSHKTTYLSTKVLGYLYRNCKRIELASEALCDTVPIIRDPDLEFDGWEEYQDQAQDDLLKYRDLLLIPARVFSISKECEVAAGVIEVSSDPKRQRPESDNAEKALNCLLKHALEVTKENFYVEFVTEDFPNWKKICKMAERFFLEACLGKKFDAERLPLLDRMLRKAIAWYKVAYQDNDNDGRKIVLGLPWVVSELLGIIKIRNRKSEIGSSLLLSRMNCVVLNIDPSFLDHDDQYEIANLILRYWINSNEKFLKLREIVHKQNCYVVIKAELDKLIRIDPDLVRESAAQQALTCLRGMSLYCCLTPDVTRDNSPQYWRIIRELGLLSFLTLSNLSSSECLWRDANEDEIIKRWKEVRESIVFVISDGFKSFFFENENQVKSVLIARTKVSSIDIEYPLVSSDDVSHQIRVQMAVDGKKWNIQLLKDLMVQPNFRSIIRDDTLAFQ